MQGIKLVMLGPPGCGKSAIFNQLCFDTRCGNDFTIGCDYAQKNVIIDKQSYNVFLWDISGKEVESKLMKVFLRDTLGVFLVCDVQEESTLNQLKQYIEKINLYCDNYNGRQIPIILLQNKSDTLERHRLVEKFQSLDYLLEYAGKERFVTAFQCSAQTGENIRKALETMIYEIQSRDLEQQQRRKTRVFLNNKSDDEFQKEIARMDAKNRCF